MIFASSQSLDWCKKLKTKHN